MEDRESQMFIFQKVFTCLSQGQYALSSALHTYEPLAWNAHLPDTRHYCSLKSLPWDTQGQAGVALLCL